LDGLDDLEVEVFDIRPHGDLEAVNGVDTILSCLSLNKVEAFQHALVRLDTHEALTQSDETCNVDDGVGRELVELNSTNKKEPTKKFVGGDKEATEKEGYKHHLSTIIGAWCYLVAGELCLP
jgi:hypothetical protein